MSRLLVISGPSGVGKSTILKKLFSKYPSKFGFSVSHTTRSPRAGEQNHIDYSFVDQSSFDSLVASNSFIEHASFSANSYGTSKAAVDAVHKQNKICVLDVELNGIKSIKNLDIPAVFIFIAPPTFDHLESRLRARGTETESSLQKRLNTAKSELEYAQGGHHDVVIVNQNVDDAFNELDLFVRKNWPQVIEL